MTIKSGMSPVHLGLVLREELDDLGLSANALAKAIDVPVNRVAAILNAERGITADTAQRLGSYFDTTAQFWLNLQQTWQTRLAASKSRPRWAERRETLSRIHAKPTPVGLQWQDVEAMLRASDVEVVERPGSRVALIKGQKAIVVHRLHLSPQIGSSTIREMSAFLKAIGVS